MEEEFLEEEEEEKKVWALPKFFLGIGIFLLVISLIALFQVSKTVKKHLDLKKQISDLQKSKQEIEKKYTDLSEQLTKTKIELDKALEREGETTEWEEFRFEDFSFSYPKKWGKLKPFMKTENILGFTTESPEVEVGFFYKEQNAISYVLKTVEHIVVFPPPKETGYYTKKEEKTPTSTIFFEKVLKVILPGKKIIPVFYLYPNYFLTDPNALNQSPLGITNINISPNLEYIYFLIFGKDWSVPKFLRLKDSVDVLEKGIPARHWFDPFSDVYWFENSEILAISVTPLFLSMYGVYEMEGQVIPPFPQTEMTPSEIAIFLSKRKNPEKLEKIISLDFNSNKNVFFKDLKISGNYLYFSSYKKIFEPITRKRQIIKLDDFRYDLSKKQTEKFNPATNQYEPFPPKEEKK
jgi:hypothetical protein